MFETNKIVTNKAVDVSKQSPTQSSGPSANKEPSVGNGIWNAGHNAAELLLQVRRGNDLESQRLAASRAVDLPSGGKVVLGDLITVNGNAGTPSLGKLSVLSSSLNGAVASLDSGERLVSDTTSRSPRSFRTEARLSDEIRSSAAAVAADLVAGKKLAVTEVHQLSDGSVVNKLVIPKANQPAFNRIAERAALRALDLRAKIIEGGFKVESN